MIAAKPLAIGGSLHIEALGATILATLTVFAWIALGAVAVRGLQAGDPVTLPVCILVGSGITSFALALFALGGAVAGGTIGTAAVSLVILATRWKQAVGIAGSTLRCYSRIAHPRITALSVALVAIIGWLSAVAPPRSADAMRYHLAHVRLIVAEGQWTRIADFHFALPFGWSLSFLPFELLGLPQGAQLLSFSLLVLLGAGLIRALPLSASTPLIALTVLLPLMHPFVLRTFSEAGADPYAIYAVFAVGLVLARFAERPGEHAAVAGFASWIGIQSRYQLVAVGIAASIVFLVTLRHQAFRGRSLARFALGTASALVLASPFYVMNLKWFGNPVWPLMMSRAAAESSYPNLIAWHYGRSLTGSLTIGTVAQSAVELFTWSRLFPLALLIVAGVVTIAVSHKPGARIVGVFGCLFLSLWVIMQPFLYPKFVLLLLPVALLGIGTLLADRAGIASSRNLARFLQIAAVALVTANAALSREAITYAFSRDSRAYHEHTWFYPVYDWINRNTSPRSRMLVIVSSGTTYYLERPYRRADPWIGGAIDWRTVDDVRALGSALGEGNYTHVIYEDRNWAMFPGGAEMKEVINQAAEQGVLTPLRSFDERLYTSRAAGNYRETQVTVYEIRRELRIAQSVE